MIDSDQTVISLVARRRSILYISLKDIWWRSPPNITNYWPIITQQCPSRAQGFLPTTMFELFCRGYKNLETVYLPKSVSLSSTFFNLGSGLPITSSEFFIAWEEVSRIISFSFYSFLISKLLSISAFLW
jgi:hypothetical protein